MRRPRQRRRCSRVEGLAIARRIIRACTWPHRTRPHNAVRAPGSDRVVMHVAGQFDPPHAPIAHPFRAYCRGEQQPPAFMPRSRSLPQGPGHPATTTMKCTPSQTTTVQFCCLFLPILSSSTATASASLPSSPIPTNPS